MDILTLFQSYGAQYYTWSLVLIPLLTNNKEGTLTGFFLSINLLVFDQIIDIFDLEVYFTLLAIEVVNIYIYGKFLSGIRYTALVSLSTLNIIVSFLIGINVDLYIIEDNFELFNLILLELTILTLSVKVADLQTIKNPAGYYS